MEVIIANFYFTYDLPADFAIEGDIAIDTEAMGLNNLRDRLCTVQFSNGNGNAYIVHFPKGVYDRSPNLIKLLTDPNRTYIFHFARFDVSIIEHYLKIKFKNIYCTKIASKLCRTYTDSHGLKDLCFELLGVRISKAQTSSNWGAPQLTTEQIDYAASDVLHLHKLRENLDTMLKQSNRTEVASECFKFLPHRARLDLMGWADVDIFHH